MLGGKVTTGKEMQKKAEGGPASRSAMAEQARRMGQEKRNQEHQVDQKQDQQEDCQAYLEKQKRKK